MSREIHVLLFSLNVILMVQSKSDTLATIKEKVFIAVENDLEEVSTFHKVIRIIHVVTLTIMGIIAAMMFFWNILDCKGRRKQFRPQLRLPESIVQSTTTLADENEKRKKEIATTSINSMSEPSSEMEPKSSDFPTIIPSKSRSSAGHDDNICSMISNEQMSLAKNRQIGRDEIEMMRHGLINCDCIRTTLQESTILPITVNIDNVHSKTATSKQTDHTYGTSEAQKMYSDYFENFRKSI